MPSHLIFLGTYTKSASRGIYAVRLDGESGALSAPLLAAEAVDPTWVTISPDKRFLYANHGSAAQARAFRVDATAGHLTALPPPPSPATPLSPPSHMTIDRTGRVLLSANYRDGFISATPILPDGNLGTANIIRHEGRGPNPERQDKPHPHSVTVSPDNRFVIVADLGLDKVFTYTLDPATAQLTPGNPPFVLVGPPGSGPRHFTFSVGGRHAYLINEMGGTVTVFDYEAARGTLTAKQTISTLPSDFSGLKWNAEIRTHPNGRFLYGSNRTHDSIAAFAIAPDTGLLTLIEIVPSGGKTPRNFALSPDGAWLVCGHQDSDHVTVFRVDATTGRLRRVNQTINVPMCVCVSFYN